MVRPRGPLVGGVRLVRLDQAPFGERRVPGVQLVEERGKRKDVAPRARVAELGRDPVPRRHDGRHVRVVEPARGVQLWLEVEVAESRRVCGLCDPRTAWMRPWITGGARPCRYASALAIWTACITIGVGVLAEVVDARAAAHPRHREAIGVVEGVAAEADQRGDMRMLQLAPHEEFCDHVLDGPSARAQGRILVEWITPLKSRR